MESAENMAGLDCHAIAERLWDFIDGEVAPAEMAQIDAHLEMCERCFPAYRFRRTFLEFLRCQEKSEVPAGLRRAVFERILEEHRRSEEETESTSLWERVRDSVWRGSERGH